MKTDGLLLDTYVWITLQAEPEKLRSRAVERIDRAATLNKVFVSPISVWEAAMLERDGKVVFDGGVYHWVEEALSKPGIELLSYSIPIAITSVYLPSPMHKDPCDRVLVATAQLQSLELVTTDKGILAFAKVSGLPIFRA